MFEVVDSKVSRFEEWAVQRFDEWWLERKIRVANHQVKLAEEATTHALMAAAQWRSYSMKLQDVRRVRGFSTRGNDWKPPVDWITVGMLAITCAVVGLTVVLATH